MSAKRIPSARFGSPVCQVCRMPLCPCAGRITRSSGPSDHRWSEPRPIAPPSRRYRLAALSLLIKTHTERDGHSPRSPAPIGPIRRYFYMLAASHVGTQPPSTGTQSRRIFDYCVLKEKRAFMRSKMGEKVEKCKKKTKFISSRF